MAWFENFTLIMRSSITALREKCEDPERMLHQVILDMEQELVSIRQSVARALADETLLRQELERAEEAVQRWGALAETALKRGDESSARQALEQKHRAEERGTTLSASLRTQSEQCARLQSSYRDLEDKIRQARQKRTLLVARLAQAETGQAIQTALSHAQGPSAFAEFQRLEKKVEQAEAMNAALARLDGHDVDAEELEREFARQEQKAKLETELAELKARINPAS
jgi:phage shock protein A